MGSPVTLCAKRDYSKLVSNFQLTGKRGQDHGYMCRRALVFLNIMVDTTPFGIDILECEDDGTLFVSGVSPGSHAAESGIKRGDMLFEVNGKALSSKGWE